MFYFLFRRFLQFFSPTMPFYAVRIGRNPGVYQTWNECKAEIEKFPKARYKKFETELEAKAFVSGDDHPEKAAETSGGTSEPAGSTKKSTRGKKTEVIDKEMEVLKGKLELLEKEKALAKKEEELKKDTDSSSPSSSKSSSLVAKTSKQSAKTKPYSRPFSTSATKSTGKTKMLEIDEVKKLAKETMDGDGTGGVVVYTDGACIFNGRYGAQAGIGVYWGPDHPSNVSEKLVTEKPTNNRAEIYAVIKAAEQAREMGISELNVHTDSQFLINSMTKWIHGWKKKGWKVSGGGDVVNKEDFQALEKASEGLKINYTHVPGHQGVVGNEAADKLAMQGAKKKP